MLDQKTQQNAIIASKTHDIANETDSISKHIVEDVLEKRFLGKDKIVEESRKNLNREEKVIIKNETKKTEKFIAKKIEATKSKDDEWESF